MKNIKKQIDELNSKWFKIRALADEIRLSAGREIARSHTGKKMNLSSLSSKIKKLNNYQKKFPFIQGSVYVAYQEYVEAEVLQAIVSEKPLPKLPVPEASYFSGVCDAIGEVKRRFLIYLIKGRRKDAMKLLDRCLELNSIIAEIDSSPAIIPAIKHKKDLVKRTVEIMLETAVRTQ